MNELPRRIVVNRNWIDLKIGYFNCEDVGAPEDVADGIVSDTEILIS
jgi:hypothetical protein